MEETISLKEIFEVLRKHLASIIMPCLPAWHLQELQRSL